MIRGGDLVIVGAFLVSVVPLLAIQSIGYSRGGFNQAFWESPLDEKLDRVVRHRWEWWLISLGEILNLVVVTGGATGLAFLLADGAGPLPWLALGVYLVAATAWLVGTTFQAAGVWRAAQERRDRGATPSWIHPLWLSGYVMEGIWVIVANLAYVAFGAAILSSGLLPGWAGWAAIGLGAAIPAAVLITRNGFPQLSLVVPFVLGMALLIQGL